MGAIISAIISPITGAVNHFVGEIGNSLGRGFKDPIDTLSEGLKGITKEGWVQLGKIVTGLTNNGWFQLPKNAVNEFENVRKDMKPWFELPRNITANMNTVTSIMEYLCVPVYSVQDCLDTWFYFERNEKHMRLPGSPEEKEWSAPYSCWRRFLTCFYRRRIYITDLEDAPHVPDMVRRYEEKNIQTIHI